MTQANTIRTVRISAAESIHCTTLYWRPIRHTCTGQCDNYDLK